MSDELGYAQAAAQLIRCYGDKAQVKATRLALDAQSEGDREGYEIWIGVAIKIHELQPAKRRKKDPLH